MLGGSSVLNYMLYVRGNRHDYDSWRDMGNEGWGYSEILKYFTKSEDNRNPYLARPGSPYHRAGGLLTVQEAPWKTPLVLSFIEAGQEVTGYPNRDINGKYQTGFMVAQVIYETSYSNRLSSPLHTLYPVQVESATFIIVLRISIVISLTALYTFSLTMIIFRIPFSINSPNERY